MAIINEILGLAQATKGTFEEAEKLVEQLGLTGDEATRALQQIRQFNSVKLDLAKQFATLNQELGLTEAQFKKLSQIAQTVDGRGEGGLKSLTANASELFGKLGFISFGFNQIQVAAQTMASAARPAFDLLITANEKLNAQLLSSQANLANATRIFQGGVELTDPTAKINASREALGSALKQIEKDTVDLVGVTSADVNQLFQTTLQNAAALNQQSKEFPGPIEAATSLTKGWAASLKVIGLPLSQSSQEINSIVRGQITQDSLLAKSLGLNNEMVNRWKAQGTLVDELNKRLGTFVTANGIASRSIEGIGSNIQDTIEIIGREAGQSLLEPVIQVMDAFYQLLKSNKDGILNFITQTIDALSKVGAIAMEMFKVLQPLLVTIGEAFLNLGEAGIQIFIDALTIAVTTLGALAVVLGPVLKVVADLVKLFAELINSDIGRIAVAATAITLAFSGLAPMFAAITLAGSGGLIPMFARLITLIPALIPQLYAMAAGWAATLAPLLLAAAPLIAVAATITAVGVGLKSIAIGDANEALDTFANTTNKLADEALNTTTKLKALQSQEKAGTPLTEEQQRQKKGLLALAKEESAAISKQIADLKQLNPQTDEQRGNLESQVKLLESQRKLLAGNDELDLKARSIDDLGTSYEQLDKKAANALKLLANEGNGDAAQLQAAAKEAISITQQQFTLGRISQEQAIQRMSDIADNKDVEIATQQQAQDAIAKLRKEQLDLSKSDIEKNIAEVNEALAAGRITEIEATKQVTAFKRQELSSQLESTKAAILAEEEAIVAGKGSGSKLKQLRQQQSQAEAEIAKNDKETREKGYKDELAERDRFSKIAQSNIEEQLSKGNLSQAESEKQLTELKSQEANKRLAIVQAALQKEITEGRGRGEFAKQLKLQVEAAETEAAQAAKKVRDEAIKRRLQDFDEEQTILNGKKAQGLVGEQEYSDQSLAITQRRLDAELAEITRQRSKIKDKEGLEELAAKEADIAKRRVEAIERFENEKLAILDRAQKKALDIVRAVQTESEIETQKLLNAREIREVEASDRNLKTKRKVTEEELKLEQAKGDAIAALPKFSDPQKEEERQAKVRSSRQRTGELTLSLLQNEREQQESTARVIQDKIDQQLKTTLNSYAEQEQGLQRLSVAQEQLVKSLERQNALLSAQKDLQSAISSFVDGEYKLAESLTQNEFRKKKLREEAARSRLAFLEREQALERQSLDLEELKNKALLEREKIQSRIAQSKAEAGLAKAEAEEAKINADPKATESDRNAARLTTKAAKDELIGVRFQSRLIDDQGGLDDATNQAKRRSLSFKQELQRDQARADLARETRGRGDNRALADEFTEKARNGRFADTGINAPASTAGKFDEFYKTELAKLGGRNDALIQQQINRSVGLPAVQQQVPTGARDQVQPAIGAGVQQPLPQNAGQVVAESGFDGLRGVIGDAIAAGFAKIQSLGTINQSNSITNNLNSADINNGKAAETVTQQILNQLYDVGRLAKTKVATN